jgi:hypothetical protein
MMSGNPEMLKLVADTKARIEAAKQAASEAALVKILTSESVIQKQAAAELALEYITNMANLTAELVSLKKSVAAQDGGDMAPFPSYSLGMAGHMLPVLSTWVYLPDVIKQISGLGIPSTAFTTEDLLKWGNHTYFSVKHNKVMQPNRPNFEALTQQVTLLSAYLGLGYIPEVASPAVWEAKEVQAIVKADLRASQYALLDQQVEDELDHPSGESKHFVC